jgi:sialate O-acetylesterase
VQAAYGGSPICAWIPPEDIAAHVEFANYAQQIIDAERAYASAKASDPTARHPFDDPATTAKLGPSSIFHAMVEPLIPLAIRGMIWYQGEADSGDGKLYTLKMRALIEGMRRSFRDPTMPFYFAQIAPYKGYGASDKLPSFWAAQAAALAVPGTGMALTIDVGNFDNIHPANKRPVGERLALQAFAKTYGIAGINADGPIFESWQGGIDQANVTFQAAGGLKTADGAAPAGFEVLNAQGKWVAAQAALGDAGRVLLSSPGAGKVLGVRYAWSPTPAVNLTDSAGLPARAFEETVAPPGTAKLHVWLYSSIASKGTFRISDVKVEEGLRRPA